MSLTATMGRTRRSVAVLCLDHLRRGTPLTRRMCSICARAPSGLQVSVTGLLSNQGEKSINFCFHNGSFKIKSIKVWYSKAQDCSWLSQ